MIRHFLGLLALATAPTEALADTVTSAVRLIDSSPRTPGLVVSKAITVPPSKKGTVLFDCGSTVAPFAYGVGSAAACLTVDPTMPAAPVITMPFEPGKPTGKAPRRADLHIGRVLDGYVLDGAAAIHDARIDLARYGITMRRKDGSYGTVAGLTVRRVDIRADEAPIAIRGGSSDILIEDARLTCTGTSGGIPAGIKIGSAGSPANHHITIRRAIVSGCEGMQGTYRQGDGIATERPDHDITIADTISTDHGDGCLDLKSSATRLDNVSVSRCNYGLRLWAQGTAGTIRIGEVRKAGIQIKPSTDWTIERLYLPVAILPQGDISADGAGGRIAVEWCSRPLAVRAGRSTITLGTTCRQP